MLYPTSLLIPSRCIPSFPERDHPVLTLPASLPLPHSPHGSSLSSPERDHPSQPQRRHRDHPASLLARACAGRDLPVPQPPPGVDQHRATHPLRRLSATQAGQGGRMSGWVTNWVDCMAWFHTSASAQYLRLAKVGAWCVRGAHWVDQMAWIRTRAPVGALNVTELRPSVAVPCGGVKGHCSAAQAGPGGWVRHRGG